MPDSLQELAAEWHSQFAEVMEAMADLRPAMDVAGDAAAGGGPTLWWRQNLDAAAGAAVWIGARETTWQALGLRVLSAAGIESAEESEQKSSYLEVIRQSLSALAGSVGGQLGREILCADGAEEEPGNALRCRITIRTDEQSLPDLLFAASAELLALLLPASKPALPEAMEDGLELSDRARGTLNLLMDVEMPVSVSFGRTEVRVQEVLRLITGSIIELDRSISEPVEVIVNNCVVARGEVVVVEGNYGVRIQEVMSRRERLQESRKYLLPAGRV